MGELKAKPAGELQVHGSGSLSRWLSDNQLVDANFLETGLHRLSGRVRAVSGWCQARH
jgi:hypothetical protein